MRLAHVRFTVRQMMVAVMAVAVVLAVRMEFERQRQQRIDAEIRAMVQSLREYRLKYPEGHGCRGLSANWPTVSRVAPVGTTGAAQPQEVGYDPPDALPRR
jgi:type II secretory pathway pseudopilin PulG